MGDGWDAPEVAEWSAPTAGGPETDFDVAWDGRRDGPTGGLLRRYDPPERPQPPPREERPARTPARKPWEAGGMSQSTWYRKRAAARDRGGGTTTKPDDEAEPAAVLLAVLALLFWR